MLCACLNLAQILSTLLHQPRLHQLTIIVSRAQWLKVLGSNYKFGFAAQYTDIEATVRKRISLSQVGVGTAMKDILNFVTLMRQLQQVISSNSHYETFVLKL